MSKSRWTPERRAKASQDIHRWAPWLRSTGPKTKAGKAASSANSRKHGYYDAANCAALAAMRDMLREQRELLQRL